MSVALLHPISIRDLGEQLVRYRNSLSAPEKSGLRILRRDDRLSLAVEKTSRLRVVVDHDAVSLAGGMLPRFALDAQEFRVKTEASHDLVRLTFRLKPAETTRLSVSAPGGTGSKADAVLKAPETPERFAQEQPRDPLTPARLRGIEARRRMLSEGGGVLSAGKVGSLLGMSRQAVDKRRKAGRLIAVSLGRRGFGYPAWQFTEDGVLPELETVLETLGEHDNWSRIVFFTSANQVTGGSRPLDALLAGKADKVLVAARTYGEQGSL